MSNPVQQRRSFPLRDAIVWRLAWKEYRLLRGFWLGLAGLTFFLQLMVLFSPVESTPAERTFGIFAVAITMGALYALACGATMFATEHETGTYDFLRALPLTPRQLLTGKLVHAVLSTLAFFAVLWLISALLTRFQLPAWRDHRNLWGLWGFGALELLAWGLFFSLLLRRPLTAAVLGIAAPSVVVHYVISFTRPAFRPATDLLPYMTAVPIRLVIVAIVFAVDVWLALQWLNERTEQSWWSRLLRAFKVTKASAPEHAAASPLDAAIPEKPEYRQPSRAVVLGRLTWQAYRQTWRTIAAIAAAAAVVATALMWSNHGNMDVPTIIRGVTLFTMVITAPLIGACLFLADHEKDRFRFFADRGIAARRVWLSRQLFGALALTVTMLIAGMVVLMVSLPLSFDQLKTNSTRLAEGVALTLGIVVLAYAVGQFCSVYLRNGLVAGVSSLIIAMGLFGWSSGMYHLGVPLWWSAAPIPLVLLWATWLRAPDWLLERRTWRARIQANLSYLVPALILSLAVICFRVYEIPVVDPGFSLDEFLTPRTTEERETAALYERAWTTIEPIEAPPRVRDERGDEDWAEPHYSPAGDPLNDREVAWVAANAESITMLLEASRQPSCRFRGTRTADYLNRVTIDDARPVRHLLVAKAHLLTAEGELESALDQYLALFRLGNHLRNHGTGIDHMIAYSLEQLVYAHLPYWAAAQGQTPELIRAALQALDQHDRVRPTFASALKSDYFLGRAMIAGNAEVRQQYLGKDGAHAATLLDYLAPWESLRAQRLLDLMINRELTALSDVESALERGGVYKWHVYAWGNPEFMQVQRWNETTGPAQGQITAVERQQSRFYQLATRRRAAQLILALEAWRLEHGRLPESLDPLVGTYLDQMPLDPSTGQAFGYFPHGVPEAMDFFTWNDEDGERSESMEANTPFVWSLAETYGSPQRYTVQGNDHPLVARYVRDRLEYFPNASGRRSVGDYWPIGWTFPIPTPIPAPAAEVNHSDDSAVLDEADK